MASLKDSRAPTLRQTALSGGQTFRAKYEASSMDGSAGSPSHTRPDVLGLRSIDQPLEVDAVERRTDTPDKERLSRERDTEKPNPLDGARNSITLQRIETGSLPLDQYSHKNIDALLSNVTSENLAKREQLVTRYLGGDQRNFDLTNAGNRALRSELGLLVDIGRSSATPIKGRSGRLDEVYKKLTLLKKKGEEYREITGLGYGFADQGVVHLFDSRDRIVATIEPEMAELLRSDPRFLPGVQLFSKLASGAPVPNLHEAAANAVAAARQGRAIGDAWIFKNDEDRVRAIEVGAFKLALPNLTTVERSILMQSILLSIASEATSRKRVAQMLLDMTPILSQIRSIEAAQKSANAAVDAFAEGDIQDGVILTGMTVLNIVGAVGGAVTPSAASISKGARATAVRSMENTSKRVVEGVHAKKVGVAEAARVRVEELARRQPFDQLEGADINKIQAAVGSVQEGARGSLRAHLTHAIGDASEFYFEAILQRLEPGALSGAQYKKMRLREIEAGQIQPSAAARELSGKLTFQRHVRTVEPDAIVYGIAQRGEGPDLRIVLLNKEEIKYNKIQNRPHGLEVKSGKIDPDQEEAYRLNIIESELPMINPPTLSGRTYVFISGDEFRIYLAEALRAHINSFKKAHNISEKNADRIRSKMLDAFEVVDIKEWVSFWLREQGLSIGGKVNDRRGNQGL